MTTTYIRDIFGDDLLQFVLDRLAEDLKELRDDNDLRRNDMHIFYEEWIPFSSLSQEAFNRMTGDDDERPSEEEYVALMLKHLGKDHPNLDELPSPVPRS